MQYSLNTDSASQMNVAKIMDIISRMPGCDGQAADAVSTYAQMKMEDVHKLLKIFKIGVLQTFRFVYHDHKWPKSWSAYVKMPGFAPC